jgi:quinohemoprotein ethanol dehydrogenase
METGNAAYRSDYRLPRRVLTYAIDGKAKLPDFTMPELVPPADPDFVPDPAQLQAGGMGYALKACMVCHGMNAIGGGAAPDLRYSPIILSEEGFRAIVKDGTLKLAGMPPSPQLADEEVEAIRAYLRMRAAQAPAEAAALKAGKTLKHEGETPKPMPAS